MSPYWLTSSLFYLTHFLNIDELLTKSNETVIQENTLFVAQDSLISSGTHKYSENDSADAGIYSEMFLSILCYIIRVIIEFTYVVLVNYGSFAVCKNYSHLILEHVLEKYFRQNQQDLNFQHVC